MEDKTLTGLAKLAQDKVDRSVQPRNKQDYRLSDDSHMVELNKPVPRPAWKKMTGAPTIGLQGLVIAPSVGAIAVDRRPFLAPLPKELADRIADPAEKKPNPGPN